MLPRQLRRQKVTQREAFAGSGQIAVGGRDAPQAAPCGGWRQPLNGRPTSILVTTYYPECNPDLPLHIAVLLGLAPAAIQQAPAADTRAAGGTAFEPQMPVSVRTARSVCARAQDRISAVALAI